LRNIFHHGSAYAIIPVYGNKHRKSQYGGAKLSGLRFDLPGKYDEQKLVEALAEYYPLKNEAPVSAKLTYFDTFDWRLYNNLLVLHMSENKLFLSQPGNRATQRAKISSPPVFIQDFPESTIKKQLAPVIEMRALLALAEVHAQQTPYRVLNSDDKTVAWLFFEKVTPARRRITDAIPLQVSVKSVRGYPEFKAVAQQLLHMGCIPSEKDTYLLALESVGRQPGDYSSKLEVQPEPQMRSDEAARLLLRTMLNVMQQN
jgi:hypothetical protein